MDFVRPVGTLQHGNCLLLPTWRRVSENVNHKMYKKQGNIR